MNDVLNSLTPSDDAIAKASETAIVDIVDWFDVKLANLFSPLTTIDSTKKSKFPLIGAQVIASVSESIFSTENDIKISRSESSDDANNQKKKNGVTSSLKNEIEKKNKSSKNKNSNREYSILLARKFESIAQVSLKIFILFQKNNKYFLCLFLYLAKPFFVRLNYHLFIYLFIYLFIHFLFIYLFIHSFIHSFVYLFTS